MQNSRNEELTAEKKRKIDRKNKNFKRKKKTKSNIHIH